MAKNPTKKMPSFIEFFKVFLSINSARQLSFPPAFVVRLNGTVPEIATLKDHFGKIWDVKLEKSERRLIIKKGWKEFANHHSLVNGDFLVFKYDMNSQFYVKVYGRDGVKKGKAPPKIDSGIHVKEEPEIETQERKTKSQSNSGSKRKYSEMASKDSKQTQKTVGRPKGKSKLRWTACSFGGSGSSLEQAKKRGRPANAKPPTYVKPENPHFVMIMTRTSRYTVGMPKKFVKKHGDGLSSPVIVKVPTGAIWQIELSKCDGQVWLEKGWKEFAECYSLSCGSFIVFKYEGHCHFSVIILDRSTSEIEYPSKIVSSLDQNDGRDSQEIERDENEDAISVETLDVLTPKRNKGGHQSCKIMKTGSTNRISNSSFRTLDRNLSNQHTSSSGIKVGSSHCSKSKFGGNKKQMTRKKNAERKVKRRSSNWSSSKAVEAANKFITKHPSFTSVVWLANTTTRATVVSVPVGFSRKYFDAFTNSVTLQVADRLWSVKLLRYEKWNVSKFCAGWNSFAIDNSLEAGDVCIFELVKSNLLNVSIFRCNG